jgi:type IV fimbrial biogenesis protein FimT
MSNRQQGFTLIESMVCLAIIAGLIGGGVPYFREITLNAARAREVNQLVQAIYYARSEAIKRNGVVSLCPSLDGSTCTTATAWQTGWLVFVNLDHDSPADRDAAEDLLRVYAPWPEGRITSNRATLSFRAFGQSGVTATIAFCDHRGSNAARAVIISQTGRPRLTDRNSSGGAIACG